MNRVLPLLSSLLLGVSATAQVQYCTVTLSAASCGPVLTATIEPQGQSGNHYLTMFASGLHRRALGVINWGSNPISVPLPGGCNLLCDYVWGHTFQSDASGEHRWGRAWPHWAVGYFYMQMGSIEFLPGGEFTVLTTDCKLVQCF